MKTTNTATSLLCLALAACASIESSEENLIGGSVVSSSKYTSTLLIVEGCTAAKVGSRVLLTAAHCVAKKAGTAEDPVSDTYLPGRTIWITTDNDLAESGEGSFQELTIESTVIHPAYIEAMVGQDIVVANGGPPDVAVVTLSASSADKIASIPSAKIDLRPLQPSDRVVIQGYGCEQGSNTQDLIPKRLKYQITRALGLGDIESAGAQLLPARRIHQGYVTTPAGSQEEGQAKLCYGDSGGPVYRGTSQKVIVGVNALVGAAWNWHTRVDASSHWKVGEWLAEQGVRTTTTKGPSTPIESCADLATDDCIPPDP